MEEKSELNDIILNKNSASANSRRVVLAVATLGIVLILVVMLMNTLTSSSTDNLPQAVLPPEPQKETKTVAGEPLFEDVKVIQEANKENGSLDEIAQRLKQESTKDSTQAATTQTQQQTVAEPKKVVETKKAVSPKESTVQSQTPSTATPSGYYVQVGSFSKNQPNKSFLDSIIKLGYGYTFHQVSNKTTPVNKVLVGPFSNEAEARKALKALRASVEPAAFLTKI
ncbi:MAG: SPOR domain-containing protein [Sulfurimonas sp.]|uniref:SPOR domain-containing protein n=1 Tax=Sulfurimonas sp. TaxID=2022749 RepID=UPI002621C493|nr:SPOR domain-containing protein [Sulfurimonas sp.]MDD2652747.1 SPOR domain-containing protein [Sulfurimonas sp.]MDD3450619.1 SPOR domain-containing protein [Sulfurimonas sp.]